MRERARSFYGVYEGEKEDGQRQGDKKSVALLSVFFVIIAIDYQKYRHEKRRKNKNRIKLCIMHKI